MFLILSHAHTWSHTKSFLLKFYCEVSSWRSVHVWTQRSISEWVHLCITKDEGEGLYGDRIGCAHAMTHHTGEIHQVEHGAAI